MFERACWDAKSRMAVIKPALANKVIPSDFRPGIV
jgi:hypothetical protein